MIIEIIKFIFYIFFFGTSILGYGLTLNNKILKNDFSTSLGEIGLLGLFFVAFYTTVVHFFLPLSGLINILFHIVGIILLFLNLSKFIKNINKSDFLISFSSIIFAIIIFYSHKPNEDFGFYHLPYIVNFTTEKIIFGLNSLQIQQGWNSIWLNIHSSFVLYASDYKLVYLLNSLFFIFIISIFTSEIMNNLKEKNDYSKITFFFSFFFLFFFIVKFSRINSFGIDVPANYLLIVSIFYFFKILQFKKINTGYFMILTIFLLFSITIRISNLPFLIIIPYLLLRNNIYKNFFLSSFFILISLFFISWVVQQFIYTSCIIFPSHLTCFDTLWHNVNYLEEFSNSTLTVNKSFESYVGTLKPEEYYENFRWVPTWFKRNFNEFFEYLITFLTPLIFLFIFKKKQKNEIREYINLDYNLYFLIMTIFIALLLWFYNSPVIRMGNHFIMLFIFCILINLKPFKKIIFSEIPKKVILSLIVFSLFFTTIKNVNRITKIDIDKQGSLWPHFHDVSYETINKKDINMNTVIQTGNPQSSVCWDTASLCRTKNFNDLDIGKFFKDYIIIRKSY